MKNQKQKIVILGAGFAGLRTAMTLDSLVKRSGICADIVLIDERDCHVYTPDLYEIATAYHAKITPECLTKLKDTVAIPITQIIHNTSVRFIRDRITAVQPKEKKVDRMRGEPESYDYLVLALGSTVNFYDIPGLEEYAFPLKTVTHALAINCHTDNFFQRLWSREETRPVAIGIGGGGPTGVELAAELPAWVNMLCKKYSYPRELVSIHLIEGGASLAGQDQKGTEIIAHRLKKLGIQIHQKSYIKNVTETQVRIEDADKKSTQLPIDILFWTGGVRPNPLLKESFTTQKNGAIAVNDFLQSIEDKSVFAAGDNAFIVDQKTGKPVPGLAQAAFTQGDILALNIVQSIRGKACKPYRPKIKGIITPLGGKYAIFSNGKFTIKGFWMWVLRRIVDLRYALSILPPFYAFKKWVSDTNVFVKND